MTSVFLIFLLGIAGAAAGTWLEGIPRASKAMVLLSGLVLVCMSFFFVLPEIAAHFGWAGGLLWVAVGFGLLWVVNRYLYAVCPSCTHTHAHDDGHGHSRTQFQGFAIPLIAASGIHSFMDGWSLGASQQQGLEELQMVFLAGIALHKLPEGLALGGILRAAMNSTPKVLVSAVGAQALALAGYVSAEFLSPLAGRRLPGVMLGIAGGTFLYLGYHALESFYQQHAHQES